MRSSLGTGECMVRSAEGDLRSPRSSPPRQAWREVQLPYDHACTCALEQTLMRWLAELGLVEVGVASAFLLACVLAALSTPCCCIKHQAYCVRHMWVSMAIHA